MPRDSNGNTVPLPGTIVATGDTVLPSQHNPMVNDVYAMMTQSLSRDGQGGMRADLNMAGFRILNVGTATQPTDAVSLGQLQNGTPVGAVIDYAGPNAPATWMFAYGQAISRTTYSALFAAIGTTYGGGDGTTTFNLPDLRGRVIAGKDNMGGATTGRLDILAVQQNILGGSGGSDRHVLTEAQMPPHTHEGETSDAGDHYHDNITARVNTPGTGNGLVNSNGAYGPQTMIGTTGSAGRHRHAVYTNSKGGGQPHNNVQPTMIMNKIIKVSY